MKKVVLQLRILKNIIGFSIGYLIFKVTGRTPRYSFACMRQLFYQTNGRFNEVIARWEISGRKEYPLVQAEGILGKLNESDVNAIKTEIDDKGYYIFPEKLSESIISQMVDFAMRTPTIPRMHSDKSPIVYNSEEPVSPIYDFQNKVIFKEPVFQQILADESVLAVAQAYLGPRPQLDLVAMWWSTAKGKGLDLSTAAQLYHFDMDRVKFLKFFIYLSNVDGKNGPHCYIEGSHRLKPQPLRRDGRIQDEEMEQYYSGSAFKEITGQKGTILAVDTSGFHKGKPLEAGERLLFQMEFATSMFGHNYVVVTMPRNAMMEDFEEKVNKYHNAFAGILKVEG
jgi:hypothetical protein